MRNEAANNQLKDSIKNDYLKGILGAYSSTIPNAMMRMNKFRPVKIDKPVPPAVGTSLREQGHRRVAIKRRRDVFWLRIGMLLVTPKKLNRGKREKMQK